MPNTTSARTGPTRARPAAPFAVMAAAFCLVGIVAVGQMYATIPLIPRLADAWSVTPADAAWATTAFAIAYAVGSLLSGPLSNRWGRRAVMVGGITAMAAVTALIPLSSDLLTGSALRAVQGLFAGAFVPMAYAHFSATVPAPRLPMALTLISASMGGTVVIGQVETQLLDENLGWRSAFWVTAPLLLIGAVAIHRVMGAPGLGDRRTGPTPGTLSSLAGMAPLYVTALLVAGTITAVYTGVQLAGPPELVGSPEAMLLLRTSALPALVAAVLLAPFLGRLPVNTRVAGAFGLATLGMAGAGLCAASPWGIGVSLFVFMFGMSTAGPALVQAIGTGAGVAAQTTAIAMYGFVLNAGGGAGARLPTLVPGLAELAYVLAAVLAVATLYLLRRALRPA